MYFQIGAMTINLDKVIYFRTELKKTKMYQIGEDYKKFAAIYHIFVGFEDGAERVCFSTPDKELFDKECEKLDKLFNEEKQQ